MEYFCGTCNSTFPGGMIIDKTKILEQSETQVLYEGDLFCPRCQDRTVYCTSNKDMIPKLRGTFVDKANGAFKNWDVAYTRVKDLPKTIKLEKKDL